MEWLERMNDAIEYIENNLCNTINYDNAARIACCSTYHFQRMFSYITNVTLAEYIRRRRLTLAAFDLQNSDDKVIDVAQKYSYDSPEAFARAFGRLHGFPPTQARQKGIQLKAYPKISFQISIKGEAEMNYKIEEKSGFEVIGLSITITKDESPYEVIPKFGDKIWHNGEHAEINKLVGNLEGTLLDGIAFDFKDDGSRRYMFGFTKPEHLTDIPEKLTTLTVPSKTWVVFEGKGDNTNPLVIQQIWKRVYSEWFPTSSYEQAKGPCIEKHKWADGDNGEYTCEVWVPVLKKK